MRQAGRPECPRQPGRGAGQPGAAAAARAGRAAPRANRRDGRRSAAARPPRTASCARRAGRPCASCSRPARSSSRSAASTGSASTTWCKRAGISHGTFYLYFANKEDLFKALLRDALHDMEIVAGDFPVVTSDETGLRRAAPVGAEVLRRLRRARDRAAHAQLGERAQARCSATGCSCSSASPRR